MGHPSSDSLETTPDAHGRAPSDEPARSTTHGRVTGSDGTTQRRGPAGRSRLPRRAASTGDRARDTRSMFQATAATESPSVAVLLLMRKASGSEERGAGGSGEDLDDLEAKAHAARASTRTCRRRATSSAASPMGLFTGTSTYSRSPCPRARRRVCTGRRRPSRGRRGAVDPMKTMVSMPSCFSTTFAPARCPRPGGSRPRS